MANRYPITYFCDDCGELFPEEDLYHYTTLPWDIASARKGESGSVCDWCNYFHNNPVLSTGHAEEATQ